eukprot:5254057-Pleurochrysis_carterae.AAC.2
MDDSYCYRRSRRSRCGNAACLSINAIRTIKGKGKLQHSAAALRPERSNFQLIAAAPPPMSDLWVVNSLGSALVLSLRKFLTNSSLPMTLCVRTCTDYRQHSKPNDDECTTLYTSHQQAATCAAARATRKPTDVWHIASSHEAK